MRIPPKLESKVMDPEDVFKKILKIKIDSIRGHGRAVCSKNYTANF